MNESPNVEPQRLSSKEFPFKLIPETIRGGHWNPTEPDKVEPLNNLGIYALPATESTGGISSQVCYLATADGRVYRIKNSVDEKLHRRTFGGHEKKFVGFLGEVVDRQVDGQTEPVKDFRYQVYKRDIKLPSPYLQI